VLVEWDPDQDTRVLTWLDSLDGKVLSQLLAVHEHKGTLSLLWNGPVPAGLNESDGVEEHGDWWSIVHSVGIEEVAETTF